MTVNIDDILRVRLRTQLIDGSSVSTPHDVASHLLALQAQDYAGSLWSLGLRLPGTTLADIERAIAERRIVRTWPMRGTLHFVVAEDVRWLLSLLTPRIVARATTRHAALGQTDATFNRAGHLFREALSGGRAITRPDAMALLEAGGIATAAQRGYHVLWMLAQQGILCCGPIAAKQQTFVLLDEWVPPGPAEQDAPPRDVALSRLAARYVRGHGPATAEDLAWWAGITKTDARAALDAVAEQFEHADVDGKRFWLAPGAHAAAAAGATAGAPGRDSVARGSADPRVDLLPGFDEYMLGYTDRTLQLGEHHETYGATVSANGMFSGTVVVDGRIAGTWKRALKRERVEIAVRAFRSPTAEERAGIDAAAERFGEFVGLAPVVRVDSAGATARPS